MASAFPADAQHQQVMSAQYAEGPRLQGETEGPNYSAFQGQSEQAAGTAEASQMNGHPPPPSQATTTARAEEAGAPRSDTDPYGSGQAPDVPLLPGVTGRETKPTSSRDGGDASGIGPRRLEAPGVSPATGPASAGANRIQPAGAFFPSPLPGGSPESAEHGRMGLESVTSRAATWMSKLGDLFQQRRVEVHTTWSPAHRAENPWLEQRPFVAPPSQIKREVSREGARSTPPSTGSATVPYELVQAEVSKQLEGAMSEIYGTMAGKLEYERKKAEEAELQAQALREQLEFLEMQTRELAKGAQPRDEGLGNDSAVRAPTLSTVQELLHPPAYRALTYTPRPNLLG